MAPQSQEQRELPRVVRLGGDQLRFLGWLGSGAFASVYECMLESSGQRFAAKLHDFSFTSGGLDPGVVPDQDTVSTQVPIVEVENLKAVGPHPNIVRLDRILTDGKARYYTLFEVCDNGSLADKLKSGPLPPSTAVAIAAKLAPAIQQVHNHGLVHRDIKPQNILLRSDSEPVLTDFGLAGAPGKNYKPDGRLTAVGTLPYLPHEALTSGTQIPAGDQYGLAVTLYQSITRHTPYKRADPLKMAMAQLGPPRPVNPDFTAQPELVRDILPILYRALDSNPNRRYASVEAFGIALENAAYRHFSPAEKLQFPGVPLREKASSEVEKGVQMYSQRAYDLALERFAEAVKNDPGNISAWMNAATTLRMQNRFTEAQNALVSLSVLPPRSTLDMQTIAEASDSLGNYAAAAANYTGVILRSYPSGEAEAKRIDFFRSLAQQRQPAGAAVYLHEAIDVCDSLIKSTKRNNYSELLRLQELGRRLRQEERQLRR